MVEALTVAPLRQGNHVTVLTNGSEIFPSMLEAIRSAGEHRFATYATGPEASPPSRRGHLAE